jgi:hypothetical protein
MCVAQCHVHCPPTTTLAEPRRHVAQPILPSIPMPVLPSLTKPQTTKHTHTSHRRPASMRVAARAGSDELSRPLSAAPISDLQHPPPATVALQVRRDPPCGWAASPTPRPWGPELHRQHTHRQQAGRKAGLRVAQGWRQALQCLMRTGNTAEHDRGCFWGGPQRCGALPQTQE